MIRAEDIIELGRSFFTLRDGGRATSIPYHRIVVVTRRGQELWRRRQTP